MTPRSLARRRALTALALAPALALAGAPAALAGPAAPGSGAAQQRSFPGTVPLPDSSSPEGIAAGLGTQFYAGSRADGSVYLADARTGRGAVLVPAQPQAPIAVGMNFDRASKLLWVAGGTSGAVSAYDGRTGETVLRLFAGQGRFLNDVALGKDAVYVTDSRNAELVVVRDGGIALLPLTGDYVQPAGFGANGIRVLPTGELLLVSGGVLYRVDPTTGVADRLEQTGGEPLVSGDGLELRGRTLYVVNGYDTQAVNRDSVAVVELANDYRSFRTVGELTDPELERPTTGALVAGALYAVNGKFETPGATEFEVVRVELNTEK